MKTKQSDSARRGYVNAKHNAEGRKVKQMKADAYGKAKTISRLKSGSAGDKLMAAYMSVTSAGQGKKALEAERKHNRMRRVRFGDKRK